MSSNACARRRATLLIDIPATHSPIIITRLLIACEPINHAYWSAGVRCSCIVAMMMALDSTLRVRNGGMGWREKTETDFFSQLSLKCVFSGLSSLIVERDLLLFLVGIWACEIGTLFFYHTADESFTTAQLTIFSRRSRWLCVIGELRCRFWIANIVDSLENLDCRSHWWLIFIHNTHGEFFLDNISDSLIHYTMQGKSCWRCW